MSDPVFIIGIACVIAAVTGGSFEAAGVKIPFISSLKRQIILFVIGLILVLYARQDAISAWVGNFYITDKPLDFAVTTGAGENVQVDCAHRGNVTVTLDKIAPRGTSRATISGSMSGYARQMQR